MWRLFYKVDYIEEKVSWKESKIYILKFKRRFFKPKYYKYIHIMTPRMLMEYDRNRRSYENKIYKQFIK
jgi:hypothetical protein